MEDRDKIDFLKKLVNKYDPGAGSGSYAIRTKKGSWMFGYDNDYPLQHGKGEVFILPDKMVEILMGNKINQ